MTDAGYGSRVSAGNNYAAAELGKFVSAVI